MWWIRFAFAAAALTLVTQPVAAGAAAMRDDDFQKAFALYRSGSTDEAYRILVSAPHSALNLSLLGSIEFQGGRLPEAEQHLAAAIALEPGLAGARFTLATVLEAEGKIEAARAQLLALIQRDPRHVEGLLVLARLENKDARFESALSWAIKAKSVAPSDPKVLYAVGVLCLQLDLIEDANRNLERSAALVPSAATLYALASARVANHDLSAAQSIYSNLLRGDDSNAQLHYALGATRFLEAQYDLAAASFEKSLSLQPGQVESLYYLGLIAKEAGDLNRSVELLTQALARRPDHARAHEALGLVYRSQGRLEDAQREFTSAIRLKPDSQKAHYQLGLVLTALQQREAAKSEFDLANRLRASADDRVSWQLLSPTEHAR